MDLFGDLPPAKDGSSDLFGDLPPTKDGDKDSKDVKAKGWAGTGPLALNRQKMLPASLRRRTPASSGALPPQLRQLRKSAAAGSGSASAGTSPSAAAASPSESSPAPGANASPAASASAAAVVPSSGPSSTPASVSSAPHASHGPPRVVVKHVAGAQLGSSSAIAAQSAPPRNTEDPDADAYSLPAPSKLNANAAVAIDDPAYHNFDTTITDEYDPAVPNDYETFCEERLARVRAEEDRKKMEQHLKEQEEHRRRMREEREREAAALMAGGATTSSLAKTSGRGIDLRPAWMRAKEEGQASGAAAETPAPEAPKPFWMHSEPSSSAVESASTLPAVSAASAAPVSAAAPPSASSIATSQAAFGENEFGPTPRPSPAAPAAAVGRGVGRGRGRGMHSSGRGVDIRPAWMVALENAGSVPGASAAGTSAVGTGNDAEPSASAAAVNAAPATSTTLASGASAASTSELSASTAPKPVGGAAAAANMMKMWGYEQGKGLGKDQSGITAPLEMKKTGVSTGTIIAPPTADSVVSAGPASVKSRVVLLQNMVGPGEVDDDLQAETQEECSRFGPVNQVLVYEVTGAQVPPEKAVRIFVEFANVSSAENAHQGLHGRFFAGRKISVSFFPEDRMAAFDLAPGPNE